jgi:hypothetical protein
MGVSGLLRKDIPRSFHYLKVAARANRGVYIPFFFFFYKEREREREREREKV